MKITRRQLRNLIETMIRPKDPTDYIAPGTNKDKLSALTSHEDEDYRRTGYNIAQTLQEPKSMTQGTLTWEDQGYEGDDYVNDINKYDASKWISLMYQQIVKHPNLLEYLDKYIGKYITPGSKVYFGWTSRYGSGAEISIGNTSISHNEFHLPAIAAVFGEDSKEMKKAILFSDKNILDNYINYYFDDDPSFNVSRQNIPTANNPMIIPFYIAIRAYERKVEADFDINFIGIEGFRGFHDPGEQEIDFKNEEQGYLIAQLAKIYTGITIDSFQIKPSCKLYTRQTGRYK